MRAARNRTVAHAAWPLPEVHQYFDYRVLRENRRVVKDAECTADRQAELEDFHNVLLNISEGKATRRVRDFIINAYVRGAISCGGSIEKVGLEGSTAVHTFPAFVRRSRSNRWRACAQALFTRCQACSHAPRTRPTEVFTKRRFRDRRAAFCKRVAALLVCSVCLMILRCDHKQISSRWNRNVMRRIAQTRNHCLKVKARIRAKGARGNWFHARRAEWTRSRARTQNLWILHLGDRA